MSIYNQLSEFSDKMCYSCQMFDGWVNKSKLSYNPNNPSVRMLTIAYERKLISGELEKLTMEDLVNKFGMDKTKITNKSVLPYNRNLNLLIPLVKKVDAVFRSETKLSNGFFLLHGQILHDYQFFDFHNLFVNTGQFCHDYLRNKKGVVPII